MLKAMCQPTALLLLAFPFSSRGRCPIGRMGRADSGGREGLMGGK